MKKNRSLLAGLLVGLAAAGGFYAANERLDYRLGTGFFFTAFAVNFAAGSLASKFFMNFGRINES
ncbi:hypothetical protein [Alteribacter natronophilus]|uniref:hypothetical protein n=1 Tax=Alteribacter natronophilus TaxID=2583810 RepID=UPI00110D7223|nr:hypothetical protein [Alteribacter natronophilus]TMW70988.1 hypothetical protein FGB90_13520 [Alteribacter natronophilus]